MRVCRAWTIEIVLVYDLKTYKGNGESHKEMSYACSADINPFVKCCGTTYNLKWEILDACRGVEKLMTIEAIYNKKLKPQLNTRDEYRERELTLKY